MLPPIFIVGHAISYRVHLPVIKCVCITTHNIAVVFESLNFKKGVSAHTIHVLCVALHVHCTRLLTL